MKDQIKRSSNKKTSFGSLEPLLKKGKNVIAELATFHSEGRSHKHDKWEICYVLEGKGVIVNGEKHIKVESNSVCKIPPNTGHWMIPEPYMEILLVYSDES